MNNHKVKVIIKKNKVLLDQVSVQKIITLCENGKDIYHRITLPIELIVKRIKSLNFKESMQENEEQIIQLPRKPNIKLDIKSTINNHNDLVMEKSSTTEVLPNKVNDTNCVKCYIF